MSQHQSERQASNNRGPVGNNDDFICFENNQINFPTQLSQFSQSQGEPAHRDHSAGTVDSSRPLGPRHKRQRSSPDVAQESPLPQILGLLSKVSQEEKEKIIAILREQDQSSIPADFLSSSTENFPDRGRASSSNSDHSLSVQLRTSQINTPGPHFHQTHNTTDRNVQNNSVPQDLPLLDGCIDPALLSSHVNPNILRNYGHTSRASMPLPNATQQTALPQRSHFSAPLPLGNPLTGGSFSSSDDLLRQAMHSGIGNMSRDSVASSSSFSLLDSEFSANSGYTSAPSFADRSAPGSRHPSSGAISPFSNPTPPTARGRRATSSTRKSSSVQSRSIPCRFPPCTVTFSREDVRKRHEKQKHDPEVATYTCLLDTCNMACDYDCQVPYHNSPFQDTRIDKVKAHLDKNHDWRLTQADIPDYWTKSYEHNKWGWICCDCGTELGSWEVGPRLFAEHFKFCGFTIGGQDDSVGRGRGQAVSDSPAVLRLGKLMNRLSTEGQETGPGPVDMRIRNDEAPNPPPKAREVTPEDEEYWESVCKEWQKGA
ncbi:hypothetical protein DL98DRAFT_573906 [Cadophora sp. DSE1049]|nr:hypothetical protein DL98DRAFT_573906 [Cadophora sp. DSE1049]